ncbi:DUF1553 domain-containing protein [Verrucomicrobiaceae bacterium N1E253]|uniref:DUF1553 domain-containing protein n=1 Tax=Oceaniferula marina TaxID=2748318 RepID=A0A851GB76_9BACT|nr:DUF1553 domain-containing protein [Oceaniferula marina]
MLLVLSGNSLAAADQANPLARKAASDTGSTQASRTSSAARKAEVSKSDHRVADRLVRPYEGGREVRPTPIDLIVRKQLKQKGIEPARPCSDEVFIRRVYLDVTGTLPPSKDVLYFLNSSDEQKRAKLIDALLEKDEFTDYWTLKWCDLLRVKSEFPVNLWPNGVQSYHRWIRDAIKENRPYDQFARELLTASGSNFRVPAVNFYRAVQGTEPEAIAEMVALTFMGVRIEHWSDADRKAMANLFTRVAYKKTVEWKEEIVHLDPASNTPLAVMFPDRKKAIVAVGDDPRVAFADWLITEKNPWFSRAICNRVWYWLLGRGIIHEPDDIRPNNPAANPELLRYLQTEFVGGGYDLKSLFRMILNSQTYQQSCIPRSKSPYAGAYFAHYTMRRLDAEVLIDALNGFGGTHEKYWSPIPEPFTFIPEDYRTITLADGSITSQFLDMFGRPSRDKGYESEREHNPTDFQRMYMLNSAEMHQRVSNSPYLKRVLREGGGDRKGIVRKVYLRVLSRRPTDQEMKIALGYFDQKSNKSGLWSGTHDLAWALLNTKEFLYKH